MNGYIEKRPEAIAAIKKAITEKWNLICMGCGGDRPYNINCHLCDKYGCERCPLARITDGENCTDDGTEYSKWYQASTVFDCGNCDNSRNLECESVCARQLKSIHAPEEAEAMLEALVQLLPPADRIEFGG